MHPAIGGSGYGATLCSAGYDHSVRFWHPTSTQCTASVQYPESQVNCLALSADSQLVAAGGNPRVKIFNRASSLNQKSAPWRTLEGHTANVTSLGFRIDGKWLFSSSEDSTVKVWDVRGAGCQLEYSIGSGLSISTGVLHQNQGEIVIGGEDGIIRGWDLAANKIVFEISTEGKQPIRWIDIAGDEYLAAVTHDGSLYIWRRQNGEYSLMQKVVAHDSYPLRCRFSKDARYVATCSADRTIKVWELHAQRCVLHKTLTGHSRWVWDIAFSADSQYIVSASSDRTLKLWDLSSEKIVREYQGHQNAVTCLALNDAPRS